MEEKKSRLEEQIKIQNNREWEGELMLYLHIPFCVKKCAYCDFLSGPAGDETREAYVKALCREIEVRCRELADRKVSSIYFGGGTPSLLLPDQMQRIMEQIRKVLPVAENAEISMECNPGTATQEKLNTYHSLGINRLSIGLQSARNEELKLLGRIHTWEEFLRTYRQSVDAGFDNINVDLISAIPGQTKESWQDSLKRVLALSPEPQHISVYSLIMEEGTPFYERQMRGEFCGDLSIPSEEEDREMYALTGNLLEQAGYHQYEISNYAKEGFACRHNCGYWTRREYLGLGIGAASLIGGSRYLNTSDLQEYLQDPLAGRTEEILTAEDEMEEFMFLGLRMNRGIRREEFQNRFGKTPESIYGEVIAKNARDGLLIADEAGIRLTDRGRDLSNYVMAQFLL